MSWPLRIATLKKGVGGPYPAPPGYRWTNVVSNGVQVVSGGRPVFTLIGT